MRIWDATTKVLITLFWLTLFFLLVIVGISIYRASGQRGAGRFTPVTPSSALDTRTGRLCWSYEPMGGSERIPLCKDLK